MDETHQNYVRGASAVGFGIVISLWCLVAFLLKRHQRPEWDNPHNDGIPMRDLELGDSTSEPESNPYVRPDDLEIFENPWGVKTPEPIHEPVMNNNTSRELNLEGEMFDIPLHQDEPKVPPPAQRGSSTLSALRSLGPRLIQWKDRKGNGRGKGMAPAVEVPTAVVSQVPSDEPSDGPSDEPSSGPSEDSWCPPAWVVKGKASVGPRKSRFVGLDLDDPIINPPDQALVAEQFELLKRAPLSGRPGMNRGCTWHGQDRDCGEGPSTPGGSRNQTSRL
ncbi:hypothetical protein diail_6360 [Diaporthe ilicicola]|nr:hypothetical protein diail_6360 [Diaporthe ilicicola]